MGTNPPPLLDFERLLAPIPGPDPAGTTLPLPIRERLEAGRREINPDEYEADDPRRPLAAKEADWPAIVGLSQEVLRSRSSSPSSAGSGPPPASRRG